MKRGGHFFQCFHLTVSSRRRQYHSQPLVVIAGWVLYNEKIENKMWQEAIA